MKISFRCPAFAGASLFALLLSTTSYAQPAESTDLYDRLADQAAAAALKLTDEQKAAVATIISERDAALAAAENDEAKAGATADAQKKLAAVLTEEQQTQFTALFDTPRIRFNFRFQKWAEVLPWVAGEAGLSLVMEAAPEGTFNYSDRREYKPDEAIDLLNGWLMIKGFTLIRRDQLLMCISLKDGIPDGTVPRISLEELSKRGRFEFVSVLIPLEAREAAVVMAEIEPLVSAWGEASPLAATKQLLVTDAADIVRSIQQVALAVPPPKAAPKPPAQAPAPKPVLTTYPVQHANPAAVVEVLEKFISGTILLDETASQITINTVPAQHALAVNLIKQLEENQGPDRSSELKSYPVDTDSPDQMITSLELAVPTATLRYDTEARRLVAFATPADHDRLVAAMRELENQATVGEDQLSVHPLKDIDPEVVQQLITSVLPDVRVSIDPRTSTLIAVGRLSELRAVQTLVDQLQPEAANISTPVLHSYPIPPEISEIANTVISSVVPNATVTPDAANNRLLIVAQPQDHETIAATLDKLAQDVAANGLTLKSYDARGITYSSISPLLQALAPDAQLIDESANQRLLAIADAEDHEKISNVLEQVRDDPDADRPQLRFYPLQDDFNQQQVTTLMSSVGVEASITVDDANNRLMVTASADDHQKFTELLEQLTPEMPAEKPQLKSYSLPKQIDNETFTSMLSSVAKKATVRIDAVNNRLLITATAEDHAAAEQLLEQLTSGLPDSEKQLRFYALPDDFNQQQFTTLMSSFGLEASVTVDDANNRLMVTASADDHQKLTELLEQLTPEMPVEKPQLKSYSLPKQIDNETFTSMLSSVAKKATVRIDAANNRLLITGTAEDHAAAEQLLEQLTSDLPDSKKRLQAYPLPQQISSETVSSMLLALAPGATVTIDPTNEHLLVTATDELQQTVAAALDQLTTGLSPKRLKLKTFLLPENVTADTVTALLSPIAPKATITADPAGKRILVAATDEDLALIGPILMQLADGQDLNQRQLKSYPLKADVDPATVTTLLNSLTPNAGVTADTAGHRLLVTATAKDHASIDSAIAQITRDARGELPELQYYPLGRVDGEYAVGILNTIVSGIIIKHEPESKRLSVVASESDHKILQETLVKLETAAPERETRALKVYSVTKSQRARFSTVLQGLTEEIPELQVLTGGEPNEMIIWAKPSHHTIVDTVLAQLNRDIPADQKPSLVVYPIAKVEAESVAEVLREIFPDASINVDSRASRLLVRARPAMQKTIKSAIQQLDEEIPEGREIKLMVYPIKGLNAETTLALINQEVPQVTVIRDDTAETIIIRGQLEDHQEVAELLETLRASQVGKRIPAVYPLSHGDPNRVREFFERAFPEAMAVVDPDARTLTILATSEEQIQIKEIIEDLSRADAEMPSTSELKVYTVRGASSNDLRSIVSESVPRARVVIANDQLLAWAQADDQVVIQKIVDGLRDASGNLTVAAFDISRIDVNTAKNVLSTVAPRTEFMIGRNGRALIAAVDEKTKADVDAALAQLEKSPAARQEQTLKFYAIDKSTAASVQSVLNSAVPEVSLLLSSDGTQLFARVTSDQHTKIEETLAQIAEENPFETSRTLKMYSFAKSGANTSTVLQRMVPSAVVNVGSQPDQLMIEATESDHAQIEHLITQLERAASDSDRELKFYDVDPIIIGNIRTTLMSVVPEVTLTASTDNTRLIAHVTGAQHDKIAQTLKQLDVEQPFNSDRTLKMYSTTRSGSNTSSVLQRMVPAAVVNSGAIADQLMIEATDRDHERITQLMAQLEEASGDTKRQLKFYDVDPATLSNTQTTLGSVVPEVTLTPSTDSTRLIAHVTSEQHDKIMQTLEQLATEQPFNSNRILKVYSIDKSGSNTSSVLQRMVPSAIVNVGSEPDQLLIEATIRDHERILQLVTQLEVASGDTERQLKFYDVDPATLPGTRSTLASVVPEVTLTASTDNTRLIAHVTGEQHEKITQTLEQLAAEQPFRSNRILKFYSVAKAGSDTSSVLQRLVPSAVITTGTGSGQLMVEATPAQHEEISRLLTQIIAAAAHDSLKVRFYSVDEGNLENIRSVVTTAVSDVSFRTSADGTQLIAVVSDDQHAKIIETLQSLAQEKPFQSNRTLKFYSAAGAGSNALTVLQRMVPSALINNGSQADQLMIEATEAQHGEVAEVLASLKEAVQDDARSLKFYEVNRTQLLNAQEIMADAVPGLDIKISADGTRLIALVTTEQDEKIGATLEQLATVAAGAPRKTTSVFDITGTDPEAIRTALEPFMADDDRVRITVDATSKRVYVHAFEDRQDDIREAITQIMAGVEEGADTQVATYFVGDGNGDEAQEALSALYPDATIVSDRSERLIIATATQEQHESIKLVAEQMQNAVSLQNNVIPRIYETTHLDASYVESVLDNLFPRDRDFIVSVNPETGQVVALAKATQHETIKALLLEIDREPETTAKTVKVYNTSPMTPTTVMATLEPLVSRHTTISAERSGAEIVVSAPAAEQTKIADLLQQMGISPEEVEKSLALYRVAPLDTRTVISALEPLVSKHVTLSSERSGQEIVVSAPPEEQEKIATLVQQMRSHRTKVEGVQIRSYLVGSGKARDAISVLSPMFPDATLVTDRRAETLVATAMPEEHEMIAEVVKQMTGRGDEANQPSPKSYLLRQYDGKKMIEMLEATFTAADDVRVTWDDRNKRIIAIARPKQHAIIGGIINELDPHDGPYTRHLRFYHLPNLDLGTVNRVVSGAIRNLDPGGSVAVDQNGETLMVTTHDRGHLLVKDALTRFKPSQPKRLKIFQLSFMDPWEAHGAIDRMIIGRIPHHHLKPDVHPDDNLQQLWVRGTDSQLKEIEQLLVQLGEVGLAAGGRGGTDANLRVVPVGKDVEGALRRIENLWPRIRTNPIRVLEPSQQPDKEREPQSVPGQFSVPPEEVGKLSTQRDTRDQASVLKEHARAADPNGLLGASIVPESKDDSASSAASTDPTRFDGTDPVIIIPGNGRITIASDDTDALNQLESLLRTIYAQGSSGIENRDFSVRRLRNTAAADVSATIQQILEEADGITYFGDVAVVPEERLNALIVYGNRTDRRRLDPLLEILDSEKIDSTRAYQTKLLPLKYASATRVVDILQSIYKVQMTAGGRRPSMGIPSGVPSEVATVLRQINAAASAPLLIIETQRETNSLIIKAPPDLLSEVAELAMELDESTFTRRANGVTLLPLKKSSSKRVMEILNNVLN